MIRLFTARQIASLVLLVTTQFFTVNESMVQQKRYTTSRVRKVCISTLFKHGQRSPFMGIQWSPLTTSWAALLFCPELRTGYSTRVDLGQNAILDIISAWVRAQCKYHTVGSLEAKTIVTCVRIF